MVVKVARRGGKQLPVFWGGYEIEQANVNSQVEAPANYKRRNFLVWQLAAGSPAKQRE